MNQTIPSWWEKALSKLAFTSLVTSRLPTTVGVFMSCWMGGLVGWMTLWRNPCDKRDVGRNLIPPHLPVYSVLLGWELCLSSLGVTAACYHRASTWLSLEQVPPLQFSILNALKRQHGCEESATGQGISIPHHHLHTPPSLSTVILAYLTTKSYGHGNNILLCGMQTSLKTWSMLWVLVFS